MPSFLPSFIAVLLAFLIGSIPFALVAARAFGIADPRTFGSGNPGASNVLRSGSKGAAILTLVGDAAKGAIAIFLSVQFGQKAGLFGEPTIALVGFAAFLGHVYSVFLKFKGGKGVATAAGVILAVDPIAGFFVLAAWLASAFIWRYSSLAAIVAALSTPIIFFLRDGMSEMTALMGWMAFVLIYRHWGNLQRLMAGNELKIGKKKST